MRRVSIATGLAAAMVLLNARAEDQESAKTCARLADNAARLACYDAAFAVPATQGTAQQAAAASRSVLQSGASPPSAPQPAVVSSQTLPHAARVQADGEAHFGDSGQLHRDLEPKDNAPNRITAKVQAATALASGTYRFALDNGQVWRTTQGDWAMAFSAGDMVTISRLPLGGYQISSEGAARSVGAMRIQ